MQLFIIILAYGFFFFSFKEKGIHLKEYFQSTTSNSALSLVSSLSDEVKETSGLANFNDFLITHNDRNNKNIIYVLEKNTGKIKARIKVSGAENKDWEDLAESDEHLFIADIGNNDGNRKDLKIYKINKSNISFKDGDKVEVDEVIEFSYPGQQYFSSSKSHNFDGEALIYLNNSLYIFSKNREGNISKVYKIPANAGKYEAALIDKIEFSGSITGAALSPLQNTLALVGYNKKGNSFVYIISDFKEDAFSSGQKKLITLGPFKQIGQTEGIVFEGNSTLYISSEKIKNVEAKLYKLNLMLN
ncbi:hypothetical protein BH23BAC1_BH23BAC1_24070 [soil metagenome]